MKNDPIILPADPADPEDFPITQEGMDRGQRAGLRHRLRARDRQAARRMTRGKWHKEALLGHIACMLEDGEVLPAPSSLDDIMSDPENRDGSPVVIKVSQKTLKPGK